MVKFSSLELLALISEQEKHKITLEYSSIFDMIEELRAENIFCDLSMMDFEDLQVSYPNCIKIYLDKIKIDISDSFQSFQNYYLWKSRPDDKKLKITNSYIKYFSGNAH